MKYATVWSLKRGVVHEPLSDGENYNVEREAVLASLERDPPLTQEQWWMEEGRRCGYVKKPVRRETAYMMGARLAK